MRRVITSACVSVLAAALLARGSRADILVRSDGQLIDGKVISQDEREVAYQPDGADGTAAQHMDRRLIVRVLTTDEHGALLADGAAPATRPDATPAQRWNVPPDPAPPPVVAPGRDPTYCVIPLHGEVGVTVLASALEKSLADALLRKPTVVVLDIESPGGMVEEARQIIDILHRYNKKLRIVALTGQDLSAAAIFSLSVREIYVKPSCTIGAATSYVPNHMNMPAKIEEKMQSAWRATARNSAEEGRHEPLLAEAMIDNDMELHLELVDGKPVVKEGPGERMLCRKGKILTLTSREAVDCGLAAGEADDLADLGETMHFGKWTEISGLGTLLADSLPARADAYRKEIERAGLRLRQDVEIAIQADPSQSVSAVTRTVPRAPQPVRPGIPGRSDSASQRPAVSRPPSPAQWKPDSLACVIALQRCEADLDDAISVAGAFGHGSETSSLKETRDRFSAVRAVIYDNRDKYGVASAGTPAMPRPAASVGAAEPRGAGAAPATRPILPPGTAVTDILGGPGGQYFSFVGAGGTPILGFRCATGSLGGKPVIRQLLPIASRTPAAAKADETLVMAREGYVVSGLTVDCDESGVVAVQIIFVASKAGRADPSDAYTSDWLGAPDQNAPKTLGGNGCVVLGVRGRRGVNQDAIGLIVLPLAAQ